MRALAFAFLAVVLLGGCAAPEPAARDRFFSLQPRVPVPPVTSAPLAATLRVEDLAARGFVGGHQIVYRTRAQPLEVQRYRLLLWEVPPGRAIAADLAAALRGARMFELVMTQARRSQADYILGGELHHFEHLPTAEPPRVAADFSLVLVRETDRQSVFTRRYRDTEPVQGTTPESMARAFNRLAERLVAQVVRDLDASRPALPPRAEPSAR